MALQVRRVITGHDATGRAIVKIDEVSKNASSGRPGATACNIWTTEGFPAKNDGAADEGLRKVATTLKNGTIFRVIEFAPGLAARNHRTDSIDYIVVISGEIDRSSTSRWCISRPATSWCSGARFTTGSTAERRRACWRSS
jgi:hypothetical protein